MYKNKSIFFGNKPNDAIFLCTQKKKLNDAIKNCKLLLHLSKSAHIVHIVITGSGLSRPYYCHLTFLSSAWESLFDSVNVYTSVWEMLCWAYFYKLPKDSLWKKSLYLYIVYFQFISIIFLK